MTKKTPRRRTTSAPSPEEKHRRLRKQIKELKAERDLFRKSLVALLHEDIQINRKQLLALVGKQPPLRELLGELEAQGG